MKIDAINTSQAINYKGSVDRSFTDYLNKVRLDTIYRAKTSYEKPPGYDVVSYVGKAIPRIMERVKTFMAKTADTTTLVMAKPRELSILDSFYPMFKNTKNQRIVNGSYHLQCASDAPKVAEDYIRIYPSAYVDFAGKKKQGVDVNGLKRLDRWSAQLIEEVNPEELDAVLAKEPLRLSNEVKTPKVNEHNGLIDRLIERFFPAEHFEMYEKALERLENIEI